MSTGSNGLVLWLTAGFYWFHVCVAIHIDEKGNGQSPIILSIVIRHYSMQCRHPLVFK
jgi:hypothetical protein